MKHAFNLGSSSSPSGAVSGAAKETKEAAGMMNENGDGSGGVMLINCK
jgi:hypothetical protein